MGENVKPLTTKSDSFFVQLKVGNLRIRVEDHNNSFVHT